MAERIATGSGPFPFQGASSVETASRGRIAVRTLRLPVVQAVQRLTAVYLGRFGEGEAERGQALLVHGDHGAGKTHALAFTMDRLARGEIRTGPGVRDTLQLYAKAEEPDVVALYRTLLSQLEARQLRDLAQRFVGVLTGETVGVMASEDADHIVARLRDEPRLVEQLLEQYVVDEGDLYDRRDTEVGRVTANSRDFRRAFSSLHREALSDLAHRWIAGHVLEPSELRKLGVDRSIDTPEMAKSGLQLLASICSVAGTALLLWVDQYEKLVLDASDEVVPEAVGVLHSLVEAIPAQDAMLVLCGNEAAFDALPVDLLQRFGANVVHARGLRIDEAEALIALYLQPEGNLSASATPKRADIEPFTSDALRVAHELSAGNVRRLLQISAESWRIAGSRASVIDGGVVAAAAAIVAGRDDASLTLDIVFERIRKLARRAGYGIREDPDADALLTLDGVPRVAILLEENVHSHDETVGARVQVDAAVRLLDRLEGAHRVVVPLGYTSEPVARELETIGVEVIPFLSTDFDAIFAGMLERARIVASAEPPLEQELEELRERLRGLEEERARQVQHINIGSAQLEGAIDENELLSRWRVAQAEWTDERRRLEDRIVERRAFLQQADLEELERLREDAVRIQRRAVVLWWAMLAVAIGVLVWSGRYDPTYDAWALAGQVAGAAVITVLLAATIWLLARRRADPLTVFVQRLTVRPLFGRMASVEDLRRVAYQVHNRRRVGASFLLTDANPQVRFAAAVAPTSRNSPDLIHALPAERSAIVRTAMAQRLGREPDLAHGALEIAVVSGTPEAVYVLEGILAEGRSYHHEELLSSEMVGRTTHLSVLAAITTESGLGPAAAVLRSLVDVEVSDLDRAIQSGLAFRARTVVQQVPMDVVRRMLRILSPFDGGLATFGDLQRIDDIERAFTGLSQLVFFSERGLLVDPEWDG
jgi:hypothetical protein